MAFEACTVAPSQFNHEAHVRLAYVYLAECDADTAVQKMRDALLNFLERNNIPRSKFHETLTRAWVLAVQHFMNRSPSTSAAEFIAKNQSCWIARSCSLTTQQAFCSLRMLAHLLLSPTWTRFH